MTRIAIICLIISFVTSNDVPLNHEDLQNLMNVFSNSETYYKNHVSNDDAVIFVGRLKNGKSTLINYLLGNTLITIRKSSFEPIKVVKVDNQTEGPRIGSFISSETTKPSQWTSNLFPNLSLWDCPGFDDNRGAVQDITNAFYVYHLMKNVKSLKMVLVIDINELLYSEDVSSFLSTLSSFERMFKKQFDDCFASTSIIFTKASKMFNEWKIDRSFIKELLIEKVLSPFNNILSSFVKAFLQYITNHLDNVAIFRRLEMENTLININNNSSSDIDDNIVSAIRNTPSLKRSSLLNVYPSFSTSSERTLRNAESDLQSVKNFVALSNTTATVCSEIINNIENSMATANEENLIAIKENVTAIIAIIDGALNNSCSLQERIQISQQLNDDIKKAIEENKMWIKINEVEFIDKILNIEMGPQVNLGFKAILDAAKSRMEIISNKIDLQRNFIKKQDYNRRKGKIEENEMKSRSKTENFMKTISVRDNIINFWNLIQHFIDYLFTQK